MSLIVDPKTKVSILDGLARWYEKRTPEQLVKARQNKVLESYDHYCQ